MKTALITESIAESKNAGDLALMSNRSHFSSGREEKKIKIRAGLIILPNGAKYAVFSAFLFFFLPKSSGIFHFGLDYI